jgi:hypothetical protein
MKANSDAPFRLPPEIADLLNKIAQAQGLSVPMVLEMLVRKEALEQGLIDTGHPEAAFGRLIETIRGWALPAQADFTLSVFKRIESTPDTMALYEQAIVPLQAQRADKRKQAVNQRLGRFCKSLIGWESDEQIPVEKSSVGLIRRYTRLKPPKK